MRHNGWPDRAHEVGVVWAVLAPVLFFIFSIQKSAFLHIPLIRHQQTQ